MVTLERLNRAIEVTARFMVEYNLPQIMPTLKRLEAERDKLLAQGDAIEYAKRVLEKLKAGPNEPHVWRWEVNGAALHKVQ